MARIVSKQNLNTVLLTTTRKNNNYMLFDKFAYLVRAQRLINIKYEGLQVDHQGNVVYQPAVTVHDQLKMFESDKARLRRQLLETKSSFDQKLRTDSERKI